MAGWAHHQISRPSSAQHMRSQSTTPKSLAPATPNRVSRAISTSALSTMAQVQTAPAMPVHSPLSKSAYNDEDEFLSTLPDPRSRAMSPANADGPPSPSQHPDLNNEVATLSNKLINAINHQTNLYDTLSATRHELEASRDRIRQLELDNEEHANQLARGILIRSSVVRDERIKMTTTVAEEKRLREEADRGRKKMELELETLTADLFEEANKMVITAREAAKSEHDAVTRKNDQLKAQLADTELLLRSHQEQLAELKQVMENMNSDRDDATNPTAPSTPGALSKFDSKEEARDSLPASAISNQDVTPSYPTSFTHLVQPVLRTDLACYDDFSSLLRISKLYAPPGSRTSSGSYGGIGLGLGLGSYVSPSQSSTIQGTFSNASTNSISTGFTTSPATPTTPGVSNGSGPLPSALPLKETRFYKRTLAEDIEPCLRLDAAPGLSWLARRSVLNSMCEGTLVVEPMPQNSTSKLYAFPCSLCGEARKDEVHARSHRFRTSESDTAQRYPLCKYCLGRIRSCCDFLGFLRVLKDGHWRTDDEEAEKAAWEESVRLREQMFWCRVGGGVIPAISHSTNGSTEKSPRTTLESEREKEMMESIAELERTGEFRPRDITPIPDIKQVDSATNSPLRERMEAADTHSNAPSTPYEEGFADKKHNDGTTSKDKKKVDEPKRLSLTIPGSFDG